MPRRATNSRCWPAGTRNWPPRSASRRTGSTHWPATSSQWHPAGSAPDPALVDDQATATLAFINGIMLTFVAGQPAVDDAGQLDRLIQGVIAGVAHVRGA